jgi:predicted histone-like DNA-binding protein
LKYKLVTRINPQNKSEQPKWYAKAVQDRAVGFEGLVTHMSEHNSPYSRGVIHGVLTDMLDCVKELLLDGKSVRIGDLGLFSVVLKTRGAKTREKWTVATHVQGVTLNVRNTKTWSNAELRKNTTLQELTAYDDGSNDTEDDDTPTDDPTDSGSDNNPGGSSSGNNPSGGGGSDSGEIEQVFIGTSVNDNAMGSVTGMGTYNKGESVTLIANANDGYRFVSWGDEVTDNPRTVTADVNGVTYSAIFEAV